MPVPLALATPAAIAGLAYMNAKLCVGHDYRLIGSALMAQAKTAIRERRDRLNLFYALESNATGKLANYPFMIFEGQQWTYRETYDIALKYGTWLKKEYNIQPKEIVAMDFMNGHYFIFLWFGLWSIGAKPAFINYNLSGKALIHCIQASGARLVLVDPEVAKNVGDNVKSSLPGVIFQTFNSTLEAMLLSVEAVRQPDSDRSEVQARNIAILIYTSGTTGLPKPAIVSWLKATVGSEHVASWMGLRQSDVYYTCMPLYHSSAALLGVLTALAGGATIAIGKKFSTKTFWDEVRISKATCIQYVGETCRYLLAAPPQIDPVTSANLDQQNNVRVAFGNGLRPEIWNRFKERFGIETIAEFYAATEGAGGSFNYSKNDFGKGAIGRHGTLASLILGPNTAMVELDWETEQPWRDPKTGLCKRVKPGEPGEALYRLDPTDVHKRFQGYYGNSNSTRSKIMYDVLAKGDAWFRTGDMLSLDSEGRTYFSDRLGDTFRWKSENVSTSEVSECLGEHPLVQEANVYGVEIAHHDGRAGCVALVLGGEPNDQLLQSLADHVQKRLPRFAVPLFLRITKQIQSTGTNKQQKHVVRAEGVDPQMVGSDALYWLRNGTYVKFGVSDWERVKAGEVKL
ncbi:long-chain fatty acid [Phlyctema vagabunda]|uniref:Long-chain fatty acid n=1 Tax=Phlyctema vagabunda TaxID=108571 RepID=A0ABR4PF32_9HELO